jgi:hypothetical protein
MNPNWKASSTTPKQQREHVNLERKKSPGGKYKIFGESKPEDEVQVYLSSSPPGEGESILEWWLNPMQRSSMPNLSIIATRIFSIPGSAAISERTWSTVGRIWTPLRNKLEPETVSMLTYLKSNNDKW